MPSFDISSRRLRLDTAADASAIVAEFAALPDVLDCVNLSGNTFGVGASVAIAEVLATKRVVRSCILSDIFTGRKLAEIPESILALSQSLVNVEVHHLDLSDNAFGPAGAVPLHEFLSKTRTLRTLTLNNNGLGIQGGRAVAAALLVQAERNVRENRAPTLVAFSAGRNRLEDESMALLAAAVAAHSSLEILRIPQNGICATGVATLVSGLRECKSLSVLDLQDNTLTRSGAAAISAGFSAWPALKVLNLSDCLLSRVGGKRVARALLRHRVNSLEALDLSFNEIDAAGAAALAEWLDQCGQRISKLELNGNTFDPSGPEVMRIRDNLTRFGNPDALDDLDEMDLNSDISSESENSDDDWEHVSAENDAALCTALNNLSV